LHYPGLSGSDILEAELDQDISHFVRDFPMPRFLLSEEMIDLILPVIEIRLSTSFQSKLASIMFWFP
jgi:hypothetical protein